MAHSFSARGRAVAAAMATLLAVLVFGALAPGARAAEGNGGVLVVGDSLEELTSPHLEELLPGVPLTINAVGGSNSYEIFDLFQESYDPSQSVIVFDAGTNDNPAYPQILAENLQKVTAEIGDRCMVVPTIHGFTVNGIDNHGKNRVVHEFAASRPGTQTPDWAGTVNRDPSLLLEDHLHPNEEGTQIRAELIAEGIRNCLAGAETSFIPGAGPESAAAEANLAAAAAEASAAAPRPKTEHLALVGRVAGAREAALRKLAAEVAAAPGAPAMVHLLAAAG